MNLRDLKYFIALAEHRHFGKAAAASFVTQPTLSAQIKKLEGHLGVVLFERTKRSVSLTPIGEALLRHARATVADAELLEETARSFSDPLAGPLRLGVIPTISPYLIPLILMPLRRQCPQLRLVLSEAITETITRQVIDHQLDAALIATPVEEPELDSLALFDEPFWLAHPRDHPLYNADQITQQDLDSTELLVLSDGHCLAGQVLDVCHRDRARIEGPLADLRASSLETLLQLVGAGLGTTLVPALAMRGGWMTDMGVIARPLELPGACRRVSLLWRRTFPRVQALAALVETIREQLPNTVRKIDGELPGR